MPTRRSNDAESPKAYLDRVVEGKLNDEPWAQKIPLDRNQLTEDQRKRLTEHWKAKRESEQRQYMEEDHRYEKEDQEELPF